MELVNKCSPWIKKEFVSVAIIAIAGLVLLSTFTVQYELQYDEIQWSSDKNVTVEVNHDERFYYYGMVVNELRSDGNNTDWFKIYKDYWPKGFSLMTSILSLKIIAIGFLAASFIFALIYLDGHRTTNHNAPIIFITLYHISLLFVFVSVVTICNLTKAFRSNPYHSCIDEQGEYVRHCQTLTGSYSDQRYISYEWGFQYGWYIGLGSLLAYLVVEIPVMLLYRSSRMPKTNSRTNLLFERKMTSSMEMKARVEPAAVATPVVTVTAPKQ
ncbi:hypothetical protein SAMD00019534_041840 [Acytostelium subglobosum LB1]|uniref:hypothetical protein n=1 Tax=Acytostelium subglobosum LB1 TaxID=1410327 RepID=UPI000644EBDF|nr:hypothetical protein SAMD00019534_041840 [Acytostelium subglobosum LB1]GAM21010.1 hypothetical protein SAMD00019534_041840 [Acytostelium subglobosum LB1]|eukprot:XP_012756144.1 hypothetical protein SAMD00019534_041840 [Acytostelium subglobosum LB1]